METQFLGCFVHPSPGEGTGSVCLETPYGYRAFANSDILYTIFTQQVNQVLHDHPGDNPAIRGIDTSWKTQRCPSLDKYLMSGSQFLKAITEFYCLAQRVRRLIIFDYSHPIHPHISLFRPQLYHPDRLKAVHRGMRSFINTRRDRPSGLSKIRTGLKTCPYIKFYRSR